MTQDALFEALLASNDVGDFEAALHQFLATDSDARWVPFGARGNNRGTIEASGDPGRSLVERLTNGIDGILEIEHDLHSGVPDCRSPKEAATTWLNVPPEGLSGMTAVQRRGLAQRVSIIIGAGSSRDARIVSVRDRGVGLTPSQMPTTILSLNESNKMQKHYLAGAYGQGGSSTFAAARYTLVASRHTGSETVGFTVVKYEDLPPEDFKIGRYVYLVSGGAVLRAQPTNESFPDGTLVKHFGYDLSNYPSPIGPNSVYGLLNQVLFDPVLPVWLDDHEVHGFRRVIKGARNALNGAIDEGDESRSRTSLSHNVRLFFSSLGAEFGRIGIEYWVLERPTSANKKPSAAFVNPRKPIVLTVNGQNHAELSQTLVRKNSELPYLRERLICHVDCNLLTAEAKRALFVSNREDARRGMVYDLIQQEIVRIFRSDDELTRLNNEARELGLEERDESAMQQMRREVARLLRMQGVNVGDTEGPRQGGATPGPDAPPRPQPPRPTPQPIELHEPPTFVRIVWGDDQDITFFPGQRRYVRIETDATSNYHNPDDPAQSRVNIISTGQSISIRGSTPLDGGRMRIICETAATAAIGEGGTIRIEISRPGLPMLFDERLCRVVERPPQQSSSQPSALPLFFVQPVNGPADERWTQLSWPDDVETIASSAEMESGTLVVYYSTEFPKYAALRNKLEQRDPALAESFTKRYEVWLAVHSLMIRKAEEEASPDRGEVPNPEEDIEIAENYERAERCRTAALAALFAAREVQTTPEAGSSE
jgi:hypothetical protein